MVENISVFLQDACLGFALCVRIYGGCGDSYSAGRSIFLLRSVPPHAPRGLYHGPRISLGNTQNCTCSSSSIPALFFQGYLPNSHQSQIYSLAATGRWANVLPLTSASESHGRPGWYASDRSTSSFGDAYNSASPGQIIIVYPCPSPAGRLQALEKKGQVVAHRSNSHDVWRPCVNINIGALHLEGRSAHRLCFMHGGVQKT